MTSAVLEKKRNHQHLFPIVNAMVQTAVVELTDDDTVITCRAGCAHCCHLFIEIAWEEAEEIVEWLLTLPEDERKGYQEKIRQNARAAREVISRAEDAKHLLQPYTGEKETPDTLFDSYFYEQSIPCAFLSDSRTCTTYENRPVSCRLHLVASDPVLCSSSAEDDDEYDIPERIETLKEEVAPVLAAVERDGRWGHFGIMVEAALLERGLL